MCRVGNMPTQQFFTRVLVLFVKNRRSKVGIYAVINKAGACGHIMKYVTSHLFVLFLGKEPTNMAAPRGAELPSKKIKRSPSLVYIYITQQQMKHADTITCSFSQLSGQLLSLVRFPEISRAASQH